MMKQTQKWYQRTWVKRTAMFKIGLVSALLFKIVTAKAALIKIGALVAYTGFMGVVFGVKPDASVPLQVHAEVNQENIAHIVEHLLGEDISDSDVSG